EESNRTHEMLHFAQHDNHRLEPFKAVLIQNSRYTTAEIALAELSAWRFAREPDPETTYDELKVYPRP
ncbi:MAG: hypothetical protein D6722_09355, partial [Bacteroidetes bacterium]